LGDWNRSPAGSIVVPAACDQIRNALIELDLARIEFEKLLYPADD
jgi:hypothetical protein